MNASCPSADRLAAHEAGEGNPEERAAITAHLQECEHCRGEVAWLSELRGRVQKLPRLVAPSRDLWDGLAPRLEARVISLPRPSGTRRLMMAAAAVLLMLAASAATVLLLRHWTGPGFQVASDSSRQGAGPEGVPSGSAAALARLANEVRALEQALPPDTRALVAGNLQLIDAAIRESEAALAANPTNPAIGRMLEARYGQRLRLLQQARRAAPES